MIRPPFAFVLSVLVVATIASVIGMIVSDHPAWPAFLCGQATMGIACVIAVEKARRDHVREFRCKVRAR